AVDGNQISREIQLMFEQLPEGSAHVTVNHKKAQVIRASAIGQCGNNGLTNSPDPGIVGLASPAESDSKTSIRREISGVDLGRDDAGDLARIRTAREITSDMDNRNVPNRQNLRHWKKDRLAADLDGELRCTNNGGPDAVAGIHDGYLATMSEL